jgi:hypothetical protein
MDKPVKNNRVNEWWHSLTPKEKIIIHMKHQLIEKYYKPHQTQETPIPIEPTSSKLTTLL